MRLTGFIVLFILCFGGVAQTNQTVTYESTSENFANPERGFYHHTEVHSGTYVRLDETRLRNYREDESITQILRVFYFEDFRTRPISDAYLLNMQADFNTVRNAGIKMIVRFAYNQSINNPRDATAANVRMHIEQLKPLLRRNADVIATVQTGFVGAWGEWYYTENFAGYTASDISEENWADRKSVVLGLLEALPEDRAVQIRTPGYKRRLFQEEALDSAEAFSGSLVSRIGHHNDCFVASSTDVGTYRDPDVEKPYLEQETQYLPMGGETCGLSSPYSDCENSLNELERFHWSYLNIDYNGSVLDEWRNQGCFEEVTLSLGHRLRLIESTVTTASAPGGSIALTLKMINEGYSSPYNKRGVEVILKNTSTLEEYVLMVNEDPRRWPVKEEFTIEILAGLPDDISSGSYEFFLNLPDPYPMLHNNPNYSIRLANLGVWDTLTGYNHLMAELSVESTNPSDMYSGNEFFELKTAMNTIDVEGSNYLQGGSSPTENLLFWGRQEGYTRVIERSENETDFVPVAQVSGEMDFMYDVNTSTGPHAYRYYLMNESGRSEYSDTITLEASASSEELPQIAIDGSDSDWGVIPPLSAETDVSAFVSRAYFDGTKANFALYGSIDTYSIYLDTDNQKETGSSTSNEEGMDYLIQNDTLFHFISGNWEATESVVTSAHTVDMVEISMEHAAFENLEFNAVIGVRAIINNRVILSDPDGSSALLIRTPPSDLPTNIVIGSPESFKESRLLLEWVRCQYCDSYQIERSLDGNSFSIINERDGSETDFTDIGLTTGSVYYYRISTSNQFGKTDYSDILSAKVGGNPLAAFQEINNRFYPNPAVDYLTSNEEWAKIELLSLSGQLLLASQNSKSIEVSSLPKGVYVLRYSNPSERAQMIVIKE